MIRYCNCSDTTLEQQLEIFDQDGVVVLQNALSQAATEQAITFGQQVTVDAMADREQHSVRDDYGPNPFLLRPVGLQEKLAVAELFLPAGVAPLLRAIFRRAGDSGTSPVVRRGGLFQTAGMAAHILLPGAPARALHRDIEQLFQGRYLDMPAYSVALHIPVSKFNTGTGGTRFATGTHRAGPPTSQPQHPAHLEAPSVEASPGDVFLFDNRIWHGSGAHNGSAPRTMLSVLFTAEWLGCYDTRVNPAIYAELPPELQACVTPGPRPQ